MLNRLFGIFRDDLAIDLGTANTRIGVPGKGVVLDEPSVVAVGGRIPRALGDGSAVGHLARQMCGRTPESISVARPVRNGVVVDFQLCETLLRSLVRKVRPSRWQARPRVLVGVPGGITPVEKRAVINSAERAGAREVLLVAKARAAAIGAGLPVAEPLASMIVDLGGGTAEIAILSLGDIVAGRSIRAGGDEMDRVIVDYLRRRYGLKISVVAAEQLRIDVGSASELDEELTTQIAGADAVTGLPRRLAITSEEIREALAEPLETIVDAIRETVDECSSDLAADLTQQGLTLCGGGALLRRLDRFIAERTGISARVAADPQGAVAAGLLICLEHPDIWGTGWESSHAAA